MTVSLAFPLLAQFGIYRARPYVLTSQHALYEFNADSVVQPALLIKILTALGIDPDIKPVITISAADVAYGGSGANIIRRKLKTLIP